MQKRKNKTIGIVIENYIAGGCDKVARDLIDELCYEKLYLFINKACDTAILCAKPLPKNVQIVHYSFVTLPELGAFANSFKLKNKALFFLFKMCNLLIRYPLMMFYIGFFYRLFRQYPMDVLLSNNGGYPGGECNRIASIAAGLLKIKNYHIVHNLATNIFLKIFTPCEYILDKLIDKYTCLICVSSQTKEVLLQKRFIKQEVVVIFNGVSAPPYALKCETRTKQLKLLNIGLLGERKNQLLIIEALHVLKSKGFDAELYLVGKEEDSGYLKMLEHQAKEYQLSVYFEGFRENPYEYYEKCDIFILSSIVESFALVRVEAMSVGMPVITTDVGDAHMQVQNGVNGFIVDSAESMANAIEMYILTPQLIEEHAKNGYAIYNSNFTRDIMIEQYQALIDKD